MKHDKDWTEAMRRMLRDAEETPPPGAWERLESELGDTAPRRMLLRRVWPQVAAVAAVLLIAAGTWEFFSGRVVSDDPEKMPVIVTTNNYGYPAADSAAQPAELVAAAADTPTEIIAKRPAVAPHTAKRPSQAEQPLPADDGAELQPGAGLQPDAGEQPRRSDNRPAKSEPEKSRRSATLPDEKFVAYTPPRKKASFGLFGGGGVAGDLSGGVSRSLMAEMVVTGPNSGNIIKQKTDYNNSSFSHYQPLSFGLSARKEFMHGLSLESGVVYTLLRSDVRMPFSSEAISQKLHFIGVPLRLNWRFYQTGPFQLYIGAGGMAEKCITAKFGSESRDEPGVLWSAQGVAGAQYDLGGTVGLYFEPDISYYFNDTRLRTGRTDHPMTFTLRLGVRFSF